MSQGQSLGRRLGAAEDAQGVRVVHPLDVPLAAERLVRVEEVGRLELRKNNIGIITSYLSQNSTGPAGSLKLEEKRNNLVFFLTP